MPTTCLCALKEKGHEDGVHVVVEQLHQVLKHFLCDLQTFKEGIALRVMVQKQHHHPNNTTTTTTTNNNNNNNNNKQNKRNIAML